MSVLETVRDRIPEPEESAGSSEETFGYRCERCGEAFEEPKLKLTRVTCPGCSSADVRSVD